MTDPRERLTEWLAVAMRADGYPPGYNYDVLAAAYVAAGEQADPATLSAMLDGLASADKKPVLHPCHVTGMHTPDHHLTSDHVCSIQARDVADQMAADLERLPRALHASCYWCGTSGYPGKASSETPAHEAWAVAKAVQR